MANSEASEDRVFPRDPDKSYALVGLVDRTSPQADKGPDGRVLSFPVLFLWELVLLLAVTFATFIFSLVKQAPLEEIANPMVTTDPAKAPWYFVGLQELLEHMHPTLAGVLIPGVLVTFLLLLPYLSRGPARSGVWFGGAKGRRIAILTGLYTLIVMPAYIVLDNAFSLREMLRGVTAQWIAQGLLPGLIMAALVAIPALILWWRGASRSQILTALFTVMIVSAVVYTLSGFLFRGPGFKLYWPWDMPNGYNPFDSF